MTTTELIKILKDNECGGVSHKPREISLFINGKYMPNPQITLSSTGDGICGPEIDLDVDGEFFEEQEPCDHYTEGYFKGYDDGQKGKLEQEPCESCISRENTLKAMIEQLGIRNEDYLLPAEATLYKVVKNMPPVQPKPKTEPCEDCISRKAVREVMQRLWGTSGELLDEIMALPSVNPQEPKTGHWVLDGSDNSLECINCGCVIYANDIMRGEPHYCPNCGARMESEG